MNRRQIVEAFVDWLNDSSYHSVPYALVEFTKGRTGGNVLNGSQAAEAVTKFLRYLAEERENRHRAGPSQLNVLGAAAGGVTVRREPVAVVIDGVEYELKRKVGL